MKNTTLHVTIDKQTKDHAAKLAREMGLTLSTIVKANLISFIATKTFYVERNHKSPYMDQIISNARSEFIAKVNTSHRKKKYRTSL